MKTSRFPESWRATSSYRQNECRTSVLQATAGSCCRAKSNGRGPPCLSRSVRRCRCMTNSADIEVSRLTDPVSAHPRWKFGWLGGAWVLTCLWFGFWSLLRCCCYETVWHTAQSQAGLAFCGLVFIRMIVAAVREERGSGWKIYGLLCLGSPFWIRADFDLVLRVRDGFFA